MPRYIDKRFIDPLDGSSPWSAPLRWLSRWGMNLVMYFADAGGGGLAQECLNPCNQPITQVRCCHLACPHTECPYDGDKWNFKCPEPYQRTMWTCLDGSTMVGCGECACGSSCGSRPWYCSIAFDLGSC
jgi:hypothetical protein